MANVRTAGPSVDEVVEREFGSGTKLMNGDTLLARITPCLENGKTAFVDFLEEGEVGWGSTEFVVMKPRAPLPDEFAYCLARDDKFREFAIQSMTGSSGRQRVQAEALGRFGIVNPSPQVAQAFAQQSNALFTRICSVERQAKTLKAIRDTLLPKLMSGEIKVSEMEIFAEGMKL
jgi:type I restriction enzyme S subunit